ncbi:hypothetical protein HPB49_015781 [Dermacentor silvarum]|uniref:Uncharacterized protein n=1 Tax=Dermacentor silvarum TaxID=543639 RepID=A0ACB8DQ41_DERSI|nr:hypothetical protein HPB49_015781 [Dermacentor silvarum]
MDGGKAGRSMSNRAQPGENNDKQRDANSLPNDGAETSKEREPTARLEPTGSKRKDKEGPRGAPFRTVKLQEHIPVSRVIDYEELDTRRVKLSCFAKGVKTEDVVGLCEGAVETKSLIKGDNLVHFFAVYGTDEEAVAAAQALNGAMVRGCPIRARHMGERWHDPGTCLPVSSDTLDVWNVPNEFLNKEKLAAVFKTGTVIKVSSTGPCKVKFSTPNELIGAVKDPACHTLDGQNLKFAMAIDSGEIRKRASVKGNARAAKRPKKSAKPGTSRPKKSSCQTKKARKK